MEIELPAYTVGQIVFDHVTDSKVKVLGFDDGIIVSVRHGDRFEMEHRAYTQISPDGGNKYFYAIREFHKAFNLPYSDIPTRLTEERKASRIKWMQEELDEYRDATTLYDEIDGLIDNLYFNIGTLVEHGVKPDVIFDIVQQANMSKLWEDGKPRYREGDFKIVKPPGWVAPEPLIQREIDRQLGM